jgi:signal transduction histidine kinase
VVADVLWGSPGPPPPWSGAARRADRALRSTVALYALIVSLTVSSRVFSDGGRADGGLAFLLLVPFPLATILVVRRPLDGWRLTLVWLVLTPFLLEPPEQLATPLEPWQWFFLCPVLLAVAWAVRPRQTVAVGAVTLLVLVSMPAWSPWLRGADGPATVLGVVVPLVVGASLGARGRATRTLAAEQLRVAEEQAARGALAERARIAREMHDVVAHHLSLIAVRSETAPYRLAPLPDPAAAELAGVAETAREALTELQRLLGVLRSDDQSVDRAPQPGVGTLPALLRDVQAAGTDLAWDVEPIVVPDLLGLTVYRIVQQAVANATQHAPGAAVRVRVVRDGDHVLVEVTNRAGRDEGRTGAGLGLQGMRERVEVHGGSLEAAREPGGGFRVRARLPDPAPGPS